MMACMWKISIIAPAKNVLSGVAFCQLKIHMLRNADRKPARQVDRPQASRVYDPMFQYVPAIYLSMPPMRPDITPDSG